MTNINGANCGNCRFATVATQPDGKIDFNQRVCKWGPPSPMLIPAQSGIQLRAVWPTLGAENHCFRHEPVSAANVLAEELVEKPERPN